MASNYPDDVWAGDPAAPWNQPDLGRSCGDCLFCKAVGNSVLTCVRGVCEAKGVSALRQVELDEVSAFQEACEAWEYWDSHERS